MGIAALDSGILEVGNLAESGFLKAALKRIARIKGGFEAILFCNVPQLLWWFFRLWEAVF